jgi:hypothetical protein
VRIYCQIFSQKKIYIAFERKIAKKKRCCRHITSWAAQFSIISL